MVTGLQSVPVYKLPLMLSAPRKFSWENAFIDFSMADHDTQAAAAADAKEAAMAAAAAESASGTGTQYISQPKSHSLIHRQTVYSLFSSLPSVMEPIKQKYIASPVYLGETALTPIPLQASVHQQVIYTYMMVLSTSLQVYKQQLTRHS